MPDTLTRRRWAVFEDEDGAFMVVTEAEGDYITMPDMDAERCEAVVAEHNDLLAHIDALTAAVEHMPTARIISQWDLVSRKAVLAILRGES